MSWWKLIDTAAASQTAALFLSLCFNVVSVIAIIKIWRSRESLQDRVTTLLIDLSRELDRRYWSERGKENGRAE